MIEELTQTSSYWVKALRLEPHPEGGFFRETYRSPLSIDVGEKTGHMRSVATCIYFLLGVDDFSAFHRIKSDEVWHFYAGASVLISAVRPDGVAVQLRLGTRIEDGDEPQRVVPAGWWFGAEVAADGFDDWPERFALVGCSVSPGFDFSNFELGSRSSLLAEYPRHSELIQRLTR
jgi:uncharacterized protein